MTAPGSGAEIIPFLKTWVNLPAAIGFTIVYAKARLSAVHQRASAVSRATLLNTRTLQAPAVFPASQSSAVHVEKQLGLLPRFWSATLKMML